MSLPVDKIFGSLLGLCLADALGSSVEGIEPSQLTHRFKSPNAAFEYATQRESLRYTDDGQMTLVLAEYLSANSAINFNALMDCFVREYESWRGMDDRAEVHGTKGVAMADLLRGNAIETYSLERLDYTVEKAGSTKGWSFPIYEEEWNYGFHAEFAHFVDCVANDKQPAVTGEDARAVMEVNFATYESAGTGRKVELPFHSNARNPIDLWKRQENGLSRLTDNSK